MKIVLLLTLALSAPSCYPLPSPMYSVSRYGLDATLVDAASGEPLRRREVSIVIDRARFDRRTSNAGKIRVSALKNRYWTWLGGPAWASVASADVEIRSDGFEPARIESARFDEAPLPMQDGRIQAGRVRMKSR